MTGNVEMPRSRAAAAAGIIAILLALNTARGASGAHEREWSPNVYDMGLCFEMFARDVASRRDKDPYVERDFYQHMLDLPVSTNAVDFGALMGKKRDLLKRAQDRLEYCKTNESAFLRLAVHLGLLVEVSTNTWFAEGVQARLKDDAALDRLLLEKGLPPRSKDVSVMAGMWKGTALNAFDRRWRLIHKWNRVLREYRRGVLEDVRAGLRDCESRLSPCAAKEFRSLFSGAARLTADENEFLFGHQPGTDGGTVCGAATNAIMRAPAGECHIECPTLDEVVSIFTTNRTAVAVEKAFAQIEHRLIPYWRDEPYKNDMSIDRMKYELAMIHRIMIQDIDTRSTDAVFASFKAKIRLSRTFGWFSNCPTNRHLFMSMAYHLRRDYSHGKADTIRDFWMARRAVNPRLSPDGLGSNVGSIILHNTASLRSRIKKYRKEMIDISASWARRFKSHVADEEYQSVRDEFTKIADLTPEEARHVFGPLPGTDGGTAYGAATNAIMKAP